MLLNILHQPIKSYQGGLNGVVGAMNVLERTFGAEKRSSLRLPQIWQMPTPLPLPPEETYRARTPLFKAVLEAQFGDDASKMGVQVDRIEEIGGEPRAEFNPGHPLANEDGYVYRPNIDVATEMVNMMQASRSFKIQLKRSPPRSSSLCAR